MYVFGYGSLTRPESVSEDVGRRLSRAQMPVAGLAGWRREWNVGSNSQSHPERTIRNPDGSVFTGVVAVLGIVEEPGVSCSGAVFPVTAGDLAKLDLRERNYRRVDVTDAVTFTGKTAGCVVYTYVPRVEAVDRLENARAEGTEVIVRTAYLEQTKAGFAGLGQEKLNEFLREEPRFEVRDVTFEYSRHPFRDIDDRTDRAPELPAEVDGDAGARQG